MPGITDTNKVGRPRVKVDVSLIVELHRLGYGHKRIARAITGNGVFISASTVNRIIKVNLKPICDDPGYGIQCKTVD